MERVLCHTVWPGPWPFWNNAPRGEKLRPGAFRNLPHKSCLAAVRAGAAVPHRHGECL